MNLDEKHYLTNILDNHLNRVQNSIHSSKSLQFNSAILIGSILIGTFGIILLGFLKPPDFSFSVQETNIAIMIFVLSTSLYFNYFLFNFFLGIKKVKKTADKLKMQKEKLEKLKIFSLDSLMKPSLAMVILSMISTLFLLNSIGENKILFLILFFSMIFFSIEVIVFYFCVKKALDKLELNTFIRYSFRIIPHLEKKSFLQIIKEYFLKIFNYFKELDIFQKFHLCSLISVIVFLMFFISLPIIFSFLVPLYYLIVSFRFTNVTWILILLVVVLQFILLYPVKKYFQFEVDLETFKNFYNELDELRNKILIDDNLDYNEALNQYKNKMSEYPFACY